MRALRRLREGLVDFGIQLRQFADRCSGSILVETAFILPIMVMLLVSGVEVSRFVLLEQKVNRIAFNTADLVARGPNPTTADIAQVFDAVQYIARPFAMGQQGVVMITAVSRPVGSTSVQVDWQQTGAGTASAASKIGAPGGTATLPAAMTLNEGDGIIIAEIIYNYEPLIFSGVIEPRPIYQVAFYKPREVSTGVGL